MREYVVIQSANYVCPLLTTLEFGRQILFKIPGIKYHETVQWEQRCSMRTVMHGDANSRFGRSFVNEAKNEDIRPFSRDSNQGLFEYEIEVSFTT
jgi:hypothetical protein